MMETDWTVGTPKKSCGGIFYFDPRDGIYRVHFPGYPVVPGSVIVHAFIKAAGQILPLRGYSIERFGFRGFVTPGEYRFRLDVLGDRLKCRLYRGDRTLASGTLKI